MHAAPCELKRATTQNNIASQGTDWGRAGDRVSCSYNYFMNGAKIKSEKYLGSGWLGGDDTACKFESNFLGI